MPFLPRPPVSFSVHTCYAMDCFGTYFTHVQTCDDVRVQSATEWSASAQTSHMSKPEMTFVFKVLYGMDCLGTYFTHVQTCHDVRVPGATEWTASVRTSRMSKPVIRVTCYGVDYFGTYTHTCPNL